MCRKCNSKSKKVRMEQRAKHRNRTSFRTGDERAREAGRSGYRATVAGWIMDSSDPEKAMFVYRQAKKFYGR